MPHTKEQLKKIACEAIDKNRDKIFAIGDSILHEPELGYKEYKTAAKVKSLFEALGYEYRDGVALTGVIASRKGRASRMKVAVMGELDAVISRDHPYACKETGAAHACGHNCMIAGLAGVAYALKDTGIMDELYGDIVLMAVPAEEYVEIEYRQALREEGKIHFLGGKQEFVRLGAMDGIDVMIMQHTTSRTEGIPTCARFNSAGFIGKLIRYIGREAHSGAAPHKGINALNAAQIGLMAVHAQRETFRDEDHIRVHPVITKGGDLVNVVPADVRIETYVRGGSMDAILDAGAKVNRAFEAGGYAVGAETVITELPGYLPPVFDEKLTDIMYHNLKALVGEDAVSREYPLGGASTDAGDISQLMPVQQALICAAEGTTHSKDYTLADKEMAYITSAKALVMTAIDLLADGAETGLDIKNNFKPAMTKAEYLSRWGRL